MTVKLGYRKLVERAEARITILAPQEVNTRRQKEGVLLVDLRDIREVKREGKIPGSVHIPRGMLEFWVDPDSPYYKSWFDAPAEIILYCNKGWRSALAAETLQTMGLENVSHMQGGLEQWLLDVGLIEKDE
jgi:rhodanese-related sulfurtransferase